MTKHAEFIPFTISSSNFLKHLNLLLLQQYFGNFYELTPLLCDLKQPEASRRFHRPVVVGPDVPPRQLCLELAVPVGQLVLGIHFPRRTICTPHCLVYFIVLVLTVQYIVSAFRNSLKSHIRPLVYELIEEGEGCSNAEPCKGAFVHDC